MKSVVDVVNRYLGAIEDGICALALGSVSIIIFGQVLSRYFFNYTPDWSEELSRYLIVWTIFIGTAIGVRNNIHIGVDALLRMMPHTMKLATEVLLNVIGVVVSVVLIWLSYEFIKETLEYEQVSPSMQISMAIPYMAMPIGLSFAVIHFILDIVKLFTTHEEPTAFAA
jgi:C4-dicarboxylate transporter DctQ subunit